MNLNVKLSNGASARDWLGTAAAAARVAALHLDEVRKFNRTDNAELLTKAEEQLIQALDELRTARTAAIASALYGRNR